MGFCFEMVMKKLIRIFLVAFVFSATLPSHAQGSGSPRDFPKISYLHYVRYYFYLRSGALDKALVELILAFQANPAAWQLGGDIVGLALDLKQLGIADLYSQKVYDLQADNSRALRWRAQVLQAQGKSSPALELLLKARRLNAQDANVLLELAGIYIDLDKKTEAIEYLDQYLKLNPDATELLKTKAVYELEQKNPRAKNSFERAFALDSSDPQILDGLIQSYRLFSSVGALKEFFGDYLHREPDNMNVKLAACNVEEDWHNRKACLEQLVAEVPQEREALLNLLQVLEAQRLWEDARDLLEAHESLFKNDPAYDLKRSFYLLNMNDLEQAVGVLNESLKRYPNNLEIRYFLALGLEDLNRFEESAARLEEIYKARPTWKEASYNYALLCGELGRDEKMEEVLAFLWKQYPRDPGILNALGFVWAEQGKNLEQAKTLIEEAVAQEPQNLFYQDSFAWVLYKLGDKNQAKVLLEKAARETLDPEILIHLAQLQQALNEPKNAWGSWLEAKLTMNKKGLEAQPRLGHELRAARKALNPKEQPSLAAVLREGMANLESYSGVFRCDWKFQSQEVRTKLGVEGSPGKFKVFLWLPGQMFPVALEELNHYFPQKQELFEDLGLAFREFFEQRSWAGLQSSKSVKQKAETARAQVFGWKIKHDDALRFESKNLKLDFTNFYYLQNKIVAPRSINFKARSLNCSCESLGYELKQK